MEENEQILNRQKCNKILHKYLNSEDFGLINFEVTTMADQFQGLLGEQYFAKINYFYADREKTLQVFLKIINGKSKIMFEITKDIKAYEKEAFMYEYLVPTYKEHNINVSFIPDFYFSERYVIILEDLNLKNYKSINKNNSLTVEHCKSSLGVLAKFHSATIIYELIKSEELGRTYSIMENHAEILDDPFSSKENIYAARYLKHSVEGLFSLIDLIPENKTSKEDFKASLMEAFDQITSGDSSNFMCSIIHSDLWHNNFLYRYENDIIIDLKLIDFQTIKYGPISLDILQFLYSNTRKEFRDKNYKEFIHHYYDVMQTSFKEHSFNIETVLPKSDYLTSCEMIKVLAKIISIIDRCITYLAAQQFSLQKNEEDLEKFLFEDRAKYIMESYKNHEQFREIITEDMVELRHLLCEN